MQKITSITLGFLLSAMLISCHYKGDVDDTIFNGEIRYINDNHKITKNVTAVPLALEGRYHGMIAVYDSLLICFNPKLPDYWFNIFNINTGEEIGSFVRRGIGPQETTSASSISQFFKRENDLMALVRGFHEDRLFIWNISQSVERRTTVFDTIVMHNSRSKSNSAPYLFTFKIDNETLLAHAQPENLSFSSGIAIVTTPFLERRTIYTNELIKVFPIYTEEIVQRETQQEGISRSFFGSWSAIKPDVSKIVQTMNRLPQINIIDIHTGEVVGYRARGGTNFSRFHRNHREWLEKRYYIVVQADNDFIYATYWGTNDIPNTIHIFDWHGRLLYELRADRDFFEIWLCQVRNRLYTICWDTDEVSFIDLNELNLRTSI